MKKLRFSLALALILFVQLCWAQQPNSKWEKWNFLMGEWVGEGNGQPGKGGGYFSFNTDLDGNILVRKSHTEFPATSDKKASVHDDLMYIYTDYTGNISKAIYFDNEGHVINYSITYSENSIVLTSEAIQNAPRFRLSYIVIDKDSVNVRFEFAPPSKPDDFKIYIEGKSVRKK
ncbi:MAG: hypothetical protein HOO91_14480 [Bacteroidales bacterium]|nr:hypothetical protein [Bacteroidales bacterium]